MSGFPPPCPKCGSVPGVNRCGDVVDRHDCARVRAICALIGEAEAATDRTLAEMTAGQRAAARERQPDGSGDAGVWTAIFHRHIDRAAVAAGLRTRGPR